MSSRIDQVLDRMSRRDRGLWRNARSLADLGSLMARWLHGDIASWPGYAPDTGPDPETTDTPGLIDTLAECNRAGFVTIGSQPGQPPTEGWDGALWEQRAAVDGFAHAPMAARLSDLERHGFVVISYTTRRRFAHRFRPSAGFPLPVTASIDPDIVSLHGSRAVHGRRVATTFGSCLPRGEVEFMWNGIGEAALADILDAWQITVIDPAWGSNELWKRLADVTA